MDNDFMDIGGGMIPIFEGRYFLEKATGKIYRLNYDTQELEEVEAPNDLDGFDDRNSDD